MGRKLTIATGRSRFQQRGWQNESLTWEEIVERLSAPQVTSETMEEYRGMKPDRRTAIKDVGGFVGGYLKDGKRRVESVYCRDLLTYDYDSFTPEGMERVRDAMQGLAWCLYSTHSHTDREWRVRIIIPLEREVMPDQFPAVARKIAERLGFGGLDKGSLDLNRLMFFPSVSKDGPYMFETGEGDMLDPREVLSEYSDWKDPQEWPLLPEESEAGLFEVQDSAEKAIRAFSRRGNGGKMEDPEEKRGIIGAFCRTYDIHKAISRFLPSLYHAAPNGHYTHAGSSTTGNALVRGGGKFLYSFHGTDPLQGRMLNSWDLVRLALFRDKDSGAGTDTRVSRLPSTKAMEELALADPEVKVRYLRERGNDFEGMGEGAESTESTDPDEATLLGMLDMKKGDIAVTAANVDKILNNDPRLRDKARLDLFSGNIEILGRLPWKTEGKFWRNQDTDSLLTYFDKRYGMRKNTQIIERTFSDYLNNRSVHPVKEYLRGLPEWDGEKRLDKLFTHVLGAEDTAVNRKLSELVFTAAVRRIEEPGAKYDYCVILHGPEGSYKSTLFAVMGGEWFSDSVSSIEGKDGKEAIQGVWIAEISELTGLKKSELATQKQFISSQADRYRPAYGKITEVRPRQCVMVGTTNEEHFLKGVNDRNRRMPVVEIDPTLRKIEGNPREWLTRWRDQLWAEAMALEKRKEPLYLGEEYEEGIRQVQERHNMDLDDPLFAALKDYLEWWIPESWEGLRIEERKAQPNNPYDAGDGHFNVKVKRQRVTIPEILEECLDMKKNHQNYTATARKVGQYMKRIPGWEFAGGLRGIFGYQKTWRRIASETEASNSFGFTSNNPLFYL